MTREAYGKMVLESNEWFTDAEIILSCIDLNLRIYEIPVEFNSLGSRKSFVKPGAMLEFLKRYDRLPVPLGVQSVRKAQLMETVFVTGGSSKCWDNTFCTSLCHGSTLLAVVHRRNVEILDAEVELLRGGLEECVRHPAALQTAQDRACIWLLVTHADAAIRIPSRKHGVD